MTNARMLMLLLSYVFIAVGCNNLAGDAKRLDTLSETLKAMESLTSEVFDHALKEHPDISKSMDAEGVEFHRTLVEAWSDPTDGGGANRMEKAAESPRFGNIAAREKAKAYVRAAKGEKAVRELDKVKPVYNSFPGFWLEYAESQVMHLDMNGALTSLNHLVTIAKHPTYAFILMEAAYSVQNRYAQSLEATRKALKLSPDLPYLYYREGRPCVVLRDHECSVRAYKKIEDIHPKSLYQIADSLFVLGRYQESVDYYNRLLDAYPAHRLVLTKLGEVYMAMEDYKEAEKVLRLEISRKRDNEIAYILLGNALLLDGKPEMALEPLGKALSINPDLPRAHILRAKCFMALGRIKEAEEESKWIR